MNLKSLLNEIMSEDAVDDLANAFETEKIPAFTVALANAIKDPKVKAILDAGLADGSLKDDQFMFSEKRIQCKELQPTQNEIGFDQSIQNLLTDKHGSLESILRGQADMGPNPIVTYDGKFIIDGHHRWSQAFTANPNSTIRAVDIKAKSGYSHLDILKVVHAAVAKQLGKVPSNTALGSNILKGTTEAIVQREVDANLTDEARNIWMEFGQNIDSDADIARQITANINLMAKKGSALGAPGREHMPQTDAGNLKTADTLKQLKGIVNVTEPFQESVREKFTRIARLRKYGNA